LEISIHADFVQSSLFLLQTWDGTQINHYSSWAKWIELMIQSYLILNVDVRRWIRLQQNFHHFGSTSSASGNQWCDFSLMDRQRWRTLVIWQDWLIIHVQKIVKNAYPVGTIYWYSALDELLDGF
jgi:hypothetical protein